MTISIDGTIDEVMQVLSTLGAAASSSSSDLILGELATIVERGAKMADVVDTILSNQTAELPELDQVAAEMAKMHADIDSLKAGTIPTSDPRFQAILDTQKKVIDAFHVVLKQTQEQPPASGDTTPPAGSGDAGSAPPEPTS